MKKAIKLLSFLFLTVSMLVGCSSSDEGDAKKVAEEFNRNIYTVDAKKITEFNKLDKVTQPAIGAGVPKAEMTPSKEYIEIMQSLDKNIQPLMAKGAYEVLAANRFNQIIVIFCDKDNYTSQVTDVTLGENSYDNEEDKAGYNYEVKLKFSSTDGKSEKTDTVRGYIGLLKEDGQWKVSIYTISLYPKLN